MAQTLRISYEKSTTTVVIASGQHFERAGMEPTRRSRTRNNLRGSVSGPRRNLDSHRRTGMRQPASSPIWHARSSGMLSRRPGSFQANRKPATASAAPSDRTTTHSGVTARCAHAEPCAQAMARRSHIITRPAPTIQMAAAVTKASRCGAAMMATPNNHALPRPRLPNSTGRAQQEAAPNAAAKPPTASNTAPVSFAVSRSIGASRVCWVIFASSPSRLSIPMFAYRRANDESRCREVAPSPNCAVLYRRSAVGHRVQPKLGSCTMKTRRTQRRNNKLDKSYSDVSGDVQGMICC